MAKVDLSFLDLSIPEKIAKGRQIVKAMTDNPNFPDPQPPLAEVTASLDELELSYNELQIAEQATAESERVYEETKKAVVELMKGQTRH